MTSPALCADWVHKSPMFAVYARSCLRAFCACTDLNPYASSDTLICNQGVRGSSPLRGTAKINHLRAATRNFRIAHMPIKSAARTRCASVPRVPTAQHHHKADPNRAASLPFLHCRRNEMETE